MNLFARCSSQKKLAAFGAFLVTLTAQSALAAPQMEVELRVHRHDAKGIWVYTPEDRPFAVHPYDGEINAILDHLDQVATHAPVSPQDDRVQKLVVDAVFEWDSLLPFMSDHLFAAHAYVQIRDRTSDRLLGMSSMLDVQVPVERDMEEAVSIVNDGISATKIISLAIEAAKDSGAACDGVGSKRAQAWETLEELHALDMGKLLLNFKGKLSSGSSECPKEFSFKRVRFGQRVFSISNKFNFLLERRVDLIPNAKLYDDYSKSKYGYHMESEKDAVTYTDRYIVRGNRGYRRFYDDYTWREADLHYVNPFKVYFHYHQIRRKGPPSWENSNTYMSCTYDYAGL